MTARRRRRASTVRDRLEALMTRRQSALVPLLPIGWPSPLIFLEMAVEVARCGATILEFQMPFSDSLADDPLMQAAARETLEQGLDFDQAMDLAGQVIPRLSAPAVLVTCYNPLLRGGVENRCEAIASRGFKGLIVTDLPPEEARRLETAAERCDLDVIFGVSATSSRTRMQLACLHSGGFVSLALPEGGKASRQEMEEVLKKLIREVRRFTVLPLCVTQGSTSRDLVVAAASLADGCVMGSTYVSVIEKAPESQAVAAAGRLTVELRDALARART